MKFDELFEQRSLVASKLKDCIRDILSLRRTEAEEVQTNTSMPLWALLLTGCFR